MKQTTNWMNSLNLIQMMNYNCYHYQNLIYYYYYYQIYCWMKSLGYHHMYRYHHYIWKLSSPKISQHYKNEHLLFYHQNQRLPQLYSVYRMFGLQQRELQYQLLLVAQFGEYHSNTTYHQYHPTLKSCGNRQLSKVRRLKLRYGKLYPHLQFGSLTYHHHYQYESVSVSMVHLQDNQRINTYHAQRLKVTGQT